MQLHLAALLASILPSVLPFVRCIFGFGAKEQRMLALGQRCCRCSFLRAVTLHCCSDFVRVSIACLSLLARVFEQPSCTPTTGG